MMDHTHHLGDPSSSLLLHFILYMLRKTQICNAHLLHRCDLLHHLATIQHNWHGTKLPLYFFA